MTIQKRKNKTRTLSELTTSQPWNLLDCETRQTTAGLANRHENCDLSSQQVKHSDNIVTFNNKTYSDLNERSMDFPDSLTLAFQKLGITSQEAKTYVTLFQKAGVEQLDDLKCKFLHWYR